MEATAIASLCHRAGYRCAIVCVTLLDRLNGDQVEIPQETYKKYVSRPVDLVTQFISSKIRKAENDKIWTLLLYILDFFLY